MRDAGAITYLYFQQGLLFLTQAVLFLQQAVAPQQGLQGRGLSWGTVAFGSQLGF